MRSAWAGLNTLFEEPTRVGDPYLTGEDESVANLQPHAAQNKAGFALIDHQDPRYQAAVEHRARFGRIVHQAAVSLRGSLGGEDHIDAVIGVLKVGCDHFYLSN